MLTKHAGVVRYIRSQRIRWIGHIVRMGKEGTVKRISECRSIVVRRIGRRRLRWGECQRGSGKNEGLELE